MLLFFRCFAKFYTSNWLSVHIIYSHERDKSNSDPIYCLRLIEWRWSFDKNVEKFTHFDRIEFSSSAFLDKKQIGPSQYANWYVNITLPRSKASEWQSRWKERQHKWKSSFQSEIHNRNMPYWAQNWFIHPHSCYYIL